MCVIAYEWVVWAIMLLCVLVCVAWQTDGATPLYVASEKGHDEVVRALVGAGAAVNQAAVREDLGGCWYSAVRWWVDVGSQRARAALCVCVHVCVCVFVGYAWRLRDAMRMQRFESCRGR